MGNDIIRYHGEQSLDDNIEKSMELFAQGAISENDYVFIDRFYVSPFFSLNRTGLTVGINFGLERIREGHTRR